jgi:hypothetical protein
MTIKFLAPKRALALPNTSGIEHELKSVPTKVWLLPIPRAPPDTSGMEQIEREIKSAHIKGFAPTDTSAMGQIFPLAKSVAG